MKYLFFSALFLTFAIQAAMPTTTNASIGKDSLGGPTLGISSSLKSTPRPGNTAPSPLPSANQSETFGGALTTAPLSHSLDDNSQFRPVAPSSPTRQAQEVEPMDFSTSPKNSTRPVGGPNPL